MENILFLAVAAIVGSIIGYLLGAIRGNGHAGLLLGFLLGPIGWLIVVAMNIGKKKDAGPDLAQYMAAKRYAAAAPMAAPAQPVKKLRIQRDGVIIGSWTTEEVTGYIESGELTWDDLYFDGGEERLGEAGGES